MSYKFLRHFNLFSITFLDEKERETARQTVRQTDRQIERWGVKGSVKMGFLHLLLTTTCYCVAMEIELQHFVPPLSNYYFLFFSFLGGFCRVLLLWFVFSSVVI